MRTFAIAALLGFTALGRADTSTDYIFASSFEIECNGVGCTYCSPADPDPICGVSSHCEPTVETRSVCTYPAGAGTTAALCATNADCADAYECVNNGMNSTCQRWCQIPAGACPATLTCTPFAQPPYTGTTEWGVCI